MRTPPLSAFSASDLAPLLDEEAAHWQSELFWDYSEVSAAVRAGLERGSLLGRAAVDEGEPVLLPTNREIEENFWRAIRWGLSGALIDLRTRAVRPARAALEELIEWVRPVAKELGAAEYLGIPTANSAERQIARYEERASLEEIYAEQVRPKEAAVGG